MFTRITTLIVGAAVIGAAVAGGGIANASAKDDQFLELLSQGGIDVGNSAKAVEAAHDFCEALEQGDAPSDIVKRLVQTGKFDQSSANAFLNASVTVYCPDQAS
jgi:Protein of unknown function (DUF732)